jgi:general secretion pathway protein J
MTAGRAQGGFTLVEVILAVLIAGLVMVGSYSVTSQVMRLSDEANTRLAVESAKAILRLALGNDLGSVIYVEKAKPDVVDAILFSGGESTTQLSGQGDRLLFSCATAASLDPGAPFPSQGFNRVEYVARPAPADKDNDLAAGISLVRREVVAVTVPRRTDMPPAVNETVLAARVEEPTIRFYGPKGSGPVSSWNSTTREQAKEPPLPAQVRLTATLVVGAQRFPLDIRVDLPERSLDEVKRS